MEVWKCLGESALKFLTKLYNRTMESERMPEEWRDSVLIPIIKNKGDVQSCSNYRGIKLIGHTLKLWERTIDLFRGACAVKGNVQVAGHVKRIDNGAAFNARRYVRRR